MGIGSDQSDQRAAAHSRVALLSLLGLALAILACSAGIVGRSANTPPVTHNPASALRLQLQIIGQYGDYARPKVLMGIRISDGTGPAEMSLPATSSLTCNGVSIKPSLQNYTPPCPRQPPGGAYNIVYTDEHGAIATFTIPVPSGEFSIDAPPVGALVHIPTNDTLTVRYTTPKATPHSSIVVDSISAVCTISSGNPCGIVYASLRPYSASTASPVPGQPTPTVYEYRGPPTPTPATPTSGATPTSPPTPRPTIGPPTPTVIASQNGTSGSVTLSGEFFQFQPAPGAIEMTTEMQVTPDQHDFAAISVLFIGTLTNHITWIR